MFYRPGQPARIAGTGAYLPGRALSNADLIARTGLALTPDWIERHTGIRARHWADGDLTTADLATEAARLALAEAAVAPESLERLVLATISGDWPTPATACAVQAKLGARCPAMDLNSACAGFLFGLEYGMRAVETGLDSALIVGAEIRSRWVNPRDRRTAPIFGDGAGAVVLRAARSRDEGFVGILLETAGTTDQLVLVPAGGAAEPPSAETVSGGRHYIVIRDPAELTRRGIDAMVDLLGRACGELGVGVADLDLIVPHQANGVMLRRIGERLAVRAERWFLTIAETGNTVAASIAIALDRARRSPRWRPGALVALASLGGGYSGGVAFYRVPAGERP